MHKSHALVKQIKKNDFTYAFSVIGVALDGHLKEDDVNLASSTLVMEGKCPADAIGIVVSYSVRVKLNCGTLGGELVTDVPFKLLHPAEGNIFRHKPKYTVV